MKKLIIIALIGLVVPIMAQIKPVYDRQVSAKFDVYLDHNKVETDSVFIGVTYLSAEPIKYFKITDNFTTYLLPDKVYNVVITHPRYQKQRFKIDTGNKVTNFDLKILLSSQEPDCCIGLLKYNKRLDACLVYPIE